MDISEFMDHLSDLIPLFIFLFWVIIAVLGAFFRKKNQSGTSASSRTQSSSQSTAPGRNISDDLRRSLEDIFGVPSEGEDLEYEEEIHKAAVNSQEQPATAFNENRLKPKRIIPAASMAEPEAETIINSGPVLSGDELKKAIIWSEILLPPLSLRDKPASI